MRAGQFGLPCRKEKEGLQSSRGGLPSFSSLDLANGEVFQCHLLYSFHFRLSVNFVDFT